MKEQKYKGNPYFLRVPWNKGGLVNMGSDPVVLNLCIYSKMLPPKHDFFGLKA